MENIILVATCHLLFGWRPARRKTRVATRTKNSQFPAERISVSNEFGDHTTPSPHDYIFDLSWKHFLGVDSTSSSGSRASICFVLTVLDDWDDVAPLAGQASPMLARPTWCHLLHKCPKSHSSCSTKRKTCTARTCQQHSNLLASVGHACTSLPSQPCPYRCGPPLM